MRYDWPRTKEDEKTRGTLYCAGLYLLYQRQSFYLHC